MNNFIYVFLVCILLLAVIIALAVMFLRHDNDFSDDDFLDEQGRHLYYDRSRIEKEEYLKNHPDENPDNLRSFRRLLGIKKHPVRKKENHQ